MKITKKNLLLPISISATALVACGVVYAFSSSSFLTQAQNYVSSQCNSALISAKNTVANNQKATVCYNYYKNIEQDASIVNQQQNITSLQTKAKSLWVFDSNGVKLGISLTNSTLFNGYVLPEQIYNTDMQTIVNIDTQGNTIAGAIGIPVVVSYSGPNCTGQTYIKTNGDQSLLNRYNDRLLKDDSGSYYSFVSNPSIVSVQMSSLKNGVNCQSDNSIFPAIELSGITNSLPNIVSLPLSYQFQ